MAGSNNAGIHHKLIQDALNILFVSFTGFVLFLLWTILLFVGPGDPAILHRRSVVILRGTFSTHTVQEEG